MNTTSAQLRTEKNPERPPYDPVKAKFLQKHQNSTDSDIFKELLFQKKIQTRMLAKIYTNTKVMKYIVVISFIASLIVGVLVGIWQA